MLSSMFFILFPNIMLTSNENQHQFLDENLNISLLGSSNNNTFSFDIVETAGLDRINEPVTINISSIEPGKAYYDSIRIYKDNYEIYSQTWNAVYSTFDESNNFEDVPNLASPNGWTSVEGTSTEIRVIPDYYGHSKVCELLDFNSGADCYMYDAFTPQSSGIIEFWLSCDSITDDFSIILMNGYPNYRAWLSHKANDPGFVATWDSTDKPLLDANLITIPFTANKWYHIKWVFDCTTDTSKFYIDGNQAFWNNEGLAEEDFLFNIPDTGISDIYIGTISADYDYSIFIDAVDYSWETEYFDGRNKFLSSLDVSFLADLNKNSRETYIVNYSSSSLGDPEYINMITEEDSITDSHGTVWGINTNSDGSLMNGLNSPEGQLLPISWSTTYPNYPRIPKITEKGPIFCKVLQCGVNYYKYIQIFDNGYANIKMKDDANQAEFVFACTGGTGSDELYYSISNSWLVRDPCYLGGGSSDYIDVLSFDGSYDGKYFLNRDDESWIFAQVINTSQPEADDFTIRARITDNTALPCLGRASGLNNLNPNVEYEFWYACVDGGNTDSTQKSTVDNLYTALISNPISIDYFFSNHERNPWYVKEGDTPLISINYGSIGDLPIEILDGYLFYSSGSEYNSKILSGPYPSSGKYSVTLPDFTSGTTVEYYFSFNTSEGIKNSSIFDYIVYPSIEEPLYLNQPRDIAMDDEGFIYITDTLNNRIVKLDSEGKFILSWGTEGILPGQFKNPVALDISAEWDGFEYRNYVYVVDHYNHRIQKFDVNGIFITEWGEKGNAEEIGKLKYPLGIAIYSPRNGVEYPTIYVADSCNRQVRIFSPSGTEVGKWQDLSLSNTFKISVNASNYVYIVDEYKNVIRYYNKNGNFLGQWGDFGSANGSLSSPSDIDFDSNGNVHILDTGNFRVQNFTSSGIFHNSWGEFGFEAGKFFSASGVLIDNENNFYVVDKYNYRIQKFNSTKNFVWEVGKPIAELELSTYTFVSNLSFEDSINFSKSRGITVDKEGNYYVCDNVNHKIVKFDKWGNLILTLGNYAPSSEFNFTDIGGITIDTDGFIYATDSGDDSIHIFTDTEYIFKIHDWNGGLDEFNNPEDLEVFIDDLNDTYLFVTEKENKRIVKLFIDKNINRDEIIGYMHVFDWSNFINYDNGELETFGAPQSITISSDQQIYITDGTNKNLLIFDLNGKLLYKFDGVFNCPFGITTDSKDNLFIVDTNSTSGEHYLIITSNNLIPIDVITINNSMPLDVSVDSQDNVLVLTEDGVLKYKALEEFPSKLSELDLNISSNYLHNSLIQIKRETFESYSHGSFQTQGNWNVIVQGGTPDGEVTIEEQVNGHEDVLRLDDNEDETYITCEYQIEDLTIGSIDLWISSTDANKMNNFYLYQDSKEIQAFSIQSNMFKYYFGGSWQDITSASSNTWYKVHIEFDMTYHCYDFYINNVLYLEDQPLATGTSGFFVNKLTFRTLHYSSQSGLEYYIDDIEYSGRSLDAAGHYIGVDSFTSYSDGPFSSQNNWTIWNQSNEVLISIKDELFGHKKVLEIEDNSATSSAGFAKFNFGHQRNEGYIEFDFLLTNVVPQQVLCYLHEDTQRRVYLTVENGWLYNINNGDSYTNIFEISNNKWYHLKIWFDTSTDSLKIWLDGQEYSGSLTFRYSASYIDKYYFHSSDYLQTEPYYMYLDAFDCSWADGYYEGRNQFIQDEYLAEESFKSDDVGTIIPTGWYFDNKSDSNICENTYSELISGYNGHMNVLKIYDNNATGYVDLRKSISASSNGTVEFWLSADDISTGRVGGLGLMNDDTVVARLLFRDSQMFCYDGSILQDVSILTGCETGIWYHVQLTFACDESNYDGNNQYYYKCYINGQYKGQFGFWNNLLQVNAIRIATWGTYGVDAFTYFDGIDWSWADGYYEGRNRDLNQTYIEYVGSESFTDDQWGTLPNDDAWTITSNNWNKASVKIVPSIAGHRNVMWLDDNMDETYITTEYNMGDSNLTGSVQFYIYVTEVYDKVTIYDLYDDSTQKIALSIEENHLRYWNYDSEQWVNFKYAFSKTWYHVKVDFDCSIGMYDVYVDGIKELNQVEMSETGGNINIIKFRTMTYGGESGFDLYVDAIDYSWAEKSTLNTPIYDYKGNIYLLEGNVIHAYDNYGELLRIIDGGISGIGTDIKIQSFETETYLYHALRNEYGSDKVAKYALNGELISQIELPENFNISSITVDKEDNIYCLGNLGIYRYKLDFTGIYFLNEILNLQEISNISETDQIEIDKLGNVFYLAQDANTIFKLSWTSKELLENWSIEVFGYDHKIILDDEQNVLLLSKNDSIMSILKISNSSEIIMLHELEIGENIIQSLTTDYLENIYLLNNFNNETYTSTKYGIKEIVPELSYEIRKYNLQSVAINSTGQISILNAVDKKIDIYNSNGTYNYTIDCTALMNPRSIIIDDNDMLYILDSPNKIMIYNPNTMSFETFVEYQELEFIDFFVSDRLFLLTVNSNKNYDIRIFDITTKLKISSILDLELTLPTSLCVITEDDQDRIYITDSMENKIKEFNSQGDIIKMWGNSGTGSSKFLTPSKIMKDSNNNLYVLDVGNGRVQKFTKEGLFITVWGNFIWDLPIDGPDLDEPYRGIAIKDFKENYLMKRSIVILDSNGLFSYLDEFNFSIIEIPTDIPIEEDKNDKTYKIEKIIAEYTNFNDFELFGILYDPPGSDSYSYIKGNTVNKYNYKLINHHKKQFNMEYVVDLHGSGWGANFEGFTWENDAQDGSIDFTFINSEEITSSKSNDKEYIGPGRGDVIWGVYSMTYILYKEITTYDSKGNQIGDPEPDLKVTKVIGDQIIMPIKDALEAFKTNSTILDKIKAMDLALDNKIENEEKKEITPLAVNMYWYGGNTYDQAQNTQNYTVGYSDSCDFGHLNSLYGKLGIDYEGINIYGKITGIDEYYVTKTNESLDGTDITYGFHLEDPISGGIPDQYIFNVSIDTQFGTYIFIVNENISKSHDPWEYNTRDNAPPSSLEVQLVDANKILKSDNIVGNETRLKVLAEDMESGIDFVLAYNNSGYPNNPIQITSEPEDDGYYYFNINTSGYLNGPNDFYIVALDNHSNNKTSMIRLIVDHISPSGVQVTPFISPQLAGLIQCIATVNYAEDLSHVLFYDGDPLNSTGQTKLLGKGTYDFGIWKYYWSTTKNMAGNHSIYARAFDKVGNYIDSIEPQVVYIGDPHAPYECSIIEPNDNSIFKAYLPFKLRVNVADELSGIKRIECWLDATNESVGMYINEKTFDSPITRVIDYEFTIGVSPYVFSNSSEHDIYIVAIDDYDNNKTEKIHIIIDGVKPSLFEIDWGYHNNHSVDLWVKGLQDSDSGIDRVEYYKDEELIGISTDTNQFHFYWLGPNGTHEVHAIAYDKAGNARNSNNTEIVIIIHSIDVIGPEGSLFNPNFYIIIGSLLFITGIISISIAFFWNRKKNKESEENRSQKIGNKGKKQNFKFYL